MSDEAIRGALEKVWERSRTAALHSIASLETAAAALSANALTETQRRTAEQEARRLASAVGVFGFWNASALAREAETLLEGTARSPMRHGSPDRRSAPGRAGRRRQQPCGQPRPRRRLRPPGSWSSATTSTFAIASPPIRARRASRSSAPRRRPRARAPGRIGRRRASRSHLGRRGCRVSRAPSNQPSGLQVIVISDSDTMDDRIQAARLGGRGFLQKPVRPAQVIDLLRDSLMVSGQERPTIVAVESRFRSARNESWPNSSRSTLV